ncbi:MAG: cation diffusion facilitator family transporter [Rhodospirillales bacterium]|nr:cation diffusion facilitator family transporter [Rhodospirillales bacterium]
MTSPQVSESGGQLRRLASAVSMGIAFILIVIKLWAWTATGSVALLTSAIDAAVDAVASVATFVGVRYAEQPADREHRYGHGKGEAVAALLQSVFLVGAGLALGFQSIQRLITPESLNQVDLGLWIMVVSLVAALGLVAMQTWVVERTGSTAIAADRAHYLTDVAVNVAVLVALGITRITGWQRADPAFALAISVYMIWNSRGIALTALRQILDRELERTVRQRIRETILACPEVKGMHDLRTRDAGDRVFVEFHLEVDGGLTVSRSHAIADATELAVAAIFPAGAEVTAHVEPVGIDDERLDDQVRRS